MKLVRKIGFGLLLGAAAGHYLSTEKGQKLIAQVKQGLEDYQANPEYYQEQAREFVTEQVNRLKTFVAEESPTEETSATVDDIIITYVEDDIEVS